MTDKMALNFLIKCRLGLEENGLFIIKEMYLIMPHFIKILVWLKSLGQLIVTKYYLIWLDLTLIYIEKRQNGLNKIYVNGIQFN